MNNGNIKFRIKWIVPKNIVEKVQQLEMCYTCFDMEKVVVSDHIEDKSNYDIVIDVLSNPNSITTSECFLQTLEEKNLRRLIRNIKYQINELGLLEEFVPEIRKLYTYGMEHFPDEGMKYKLYYAIIGDYNYINQQSLKYLWEYVMHYDDTTIYDGNRALAYYILARNENDSISSKKLFRKALGLFEVERLEYDAPELYAWQHAFCLIEWADIMSATRLELNQYREGKMVPCKLSYDKAINIMKPYIKYEVTRIGRFVGDQRKKYENNIRSLVDKFDARLKESKFASDYSGILPQYTEECIELSNEKLADN